MKYQLTVVCDSERELVETFGKLAASTKTPATTAPKAPKKAPAKKELEPEFEMPEEEEAPAEEMPEETPEEMPEETPEETPAEDEGISDDDIRARGAQYVTKKGDAGRKKLKVMLAKFKVTKLSEVPQKKREAFLKELGA